MFGWLRDNRFSRAHHDARVHASRAYRDSGGRLYHLIGRTADRAFVFMPCISGQVLIVPSENDWTQAMTPAERDPHCLTFTRWRVW